MKENGNWAAKSSCQAFWHTEIEGTQGKHMKKYEHARRAAKSSGQGFRHATRLRDKWKETKYSLWETHERECQEGCKIIRPKLTQTDQGWEANGKVIQQSLLTDAWKKCKESCKLIWPRIQKKQKNGAASLFLKHQQTGSKPRLGEGSYVETESASSFWRWPHEVQRWKAQICRSRKEVKHQFMEN